MDRQIRHFAGDVPERDVDCADGLGVDVADRAPEILPDRADVERIAAHHDRLQAPQDLGREMIRRGVGRTEERIADHAFIRIDAHHADVGRAAAERVAIRRGWRLPAVDHNGEIGNPHNYWSITEPSSYSRVPSQRIL